MTDATCSVHGAAGCPTAYPPAASSVAANRNIPVLGFAVPTQNKGRWYSLIATHQHMRIRLAFTMSKVVGRGPRAAAFPAYCAS
jgi:hypothetical protein